MELEDAVAVVTGGAVRIGRAISIALAQAKAKVVVHYSHSEGPARTTVEEILAAGGKAAAVQADFQNPAPAARTVMQFAVDTFGRSDVLINSAAIFESGTLAATDESAWDRHFAINLKAPTFLCREFAQRVDSKRRAAIVNIADWRGLHPLPGHLAYTLTKTAVIALTKILALELAPQVRVNAVAPGAILAPAGADSAYMNRVAEHVPLGRTGGVADVTGAILFLLRSDFVTGEILCATGGEHLL